MRLFGITVDPLFIVIAVILLFAVAVWLAVRISIFQRELRYINNEINRTDGRERKVWLRRRRRLWRSLIPFYRREIKTL